MKNTILIFVIAFSMHLTAQINLEHIYDGASNYSSNKLMIIKFEESGEKYIKINTDEKSVSFYDLNHSLIKIISYANNPYPQSINPIPTFLYFSEKLFNNDSKIEFIFYYTKGNPSIPYTRIYNEDDSLLFSADSIAPMVTVNVPQQQQPIYNTIQGTKMILSHKYTNEAKVFSLPGTLSTSIAEANGQLMQAQGGQGQFSGLYPNPSNGSVTLQYELPMGEPNGEIVLFDLQGAEVKRYNVDNTFNDVLLDNTMLPAGTYFYQLVTARGAVGTKKSVVVK